LAQTVNLKRSFKHLNQVPFFEEENDKNKADILFKKIPIVELDDGWILDNKPFLLNPAPEHTYMVDKTELISLSNVKE